MKLESAPAIRRDYLGLHRIRRLQRASRDKLMVYSNNSRTSFPPGGHGFRERLDVLLHLLQVGEIDIHHVAGVEFGVGDVRAVGGVQGHVVEA